MTTLARSLEKPMPPHLARQLRRFLSYASVTLLASALLSAFLMPFVYMVATAFKDRQQFSQPKAPIWPASEATYTYTGPERSFPISYVTRAGEIKEETVTLAPDQAFAIYKVPGEGETRSWALVVKRPEESFFLDPGNPDAGLIKWTGKWQTLERDWVFDPRWENFTKAWSEIQFPILLRNTFAIAILGDIGTLLSSIAVAYGFSRFRIPGKNVLFTVLIATIILPPYVTMIPAYAFYSAIGWNGTWLPLIVPHFFANAYNVFLLRQFFMTIPRELDEAAMIDGASPLRTLTSVILPQSVPAVVAVALSHFFWSWNDFLGPLLYLTGQKDLQPISLGIQTYNALYSNQPHMVQATSLMGLLIPVILFFLAQGAFMRGIVITGVEK